MMRKNKTPVRLNVKVPVLPADDIRILSQTPLIGVKWNMLSAAAWKYLAAFGHSKLNEREDMQLMAVSKSEFVYQHLKNPSEKVRRLHEMKWML